MGDGFGGVQGSFLTDFKNDERFRIKNKLNTQFSSEIIEEKSYKEYK